MRPRNVDTEERPFVLIWELTQAYELSCKHCRAEAQPDRHPGELTTDEAMAFLDDCREFAEEQLGVFSGGDPLAREDALDLVRYGTDIGLQVTMTPSGTASLDRMVISTMTTMRPILVQATTRMGEIPCRPRSNRRV